MDNHKRTMLRKFRRWLVIKKFTFLRGYGNISMLMLGVLTASSLKAAFPGVINSFEKFILLIVVGFLGIYFVGWLDRRSGFLHEENIYATEVSPLMMEVVNSARDKK